MDQDPYQLQQVVVEPTIPQTELLTVPDVKAQYNVNQVDLLMAGQQGDLPTSSALINNEFSYITALMNTNILAVEKYMGTTTINTYT